MDTYIKNFRFHDAPFSSLWTPVIGGTIYLMVIYYLQSIVKRPYPLKFATLLHNFILCAGSFLMETFVLINVYDIGMRKGFFYTYCDEPLHPLGNMRSGPIAFWCYVFYLSKFYEMLDTVLLVLKKKPLALVHVWHHFIVPFFLWTMQESMVTGHWIMMVINCTIHTFMYYYYFMYTLGFEIWWKRYLTQMQIVQFFFGMIAVWPPFFAIKVWDVWHCSGEVWAVAFGSFVGLSFIILFSSFYVRTYLQKSAQGKKVLSGKKEHIGTKEEEDYVLNGKSKQQKPKEE